MRPCLLPPLVGHKSASVPYTFLRENESLQMESESPHSLWHPPHPQAQA